MALFSDHNLYPGINAHLNSFLQQPDGGWESFHATHIEDIRAALDVQLPANYYAVAEKSLQIGEIGFDFGHTPRTRPDVAIFQARRPVAEQPVSDAGFTPTATFPLLLDDEDDYLNAVIIYEFEPGKLPGNPVARIELLSPSNKPPNQDARQYLSRRVVTLRAGITLVEIDYLHETRSVIRHVPSYPNGDNDAFPYLISVSRPYPTPNEGYTELYGFGVDDRLPVINIPLVGKDKVTLDLGSVYNQTFAHVRVFQMVVDYDQEPINFDHYHEADREIIRRRLAQIRQQTNR